MPLYLQIGQRSGSCALSSYIPTSLTLDAQESFRCRGLHHAAIVCRDNE
jgi:hypothetical protein